MSRERLIYMIVALALLGIAALTFRTFIDTSGVASARRPTAPQLPLGVYANPHAPNGSEKLTLLPGGRFTLRFLEDNTEIKGAYTISQDQVVFTEGAGGSCPGTPGTYKWAFDGSVINWTVVSDGCPARISDWLSKPWTRQP